MSRTRSEYRGSIATLPPATAIDVVPVPVDRRDDLATLMLEAYRGTIDDEGEDLDDARSAIDHYFTVIDRTRSFMVLDAARIVAMSFVLVVDGIHYIDPVAVASTHKRRGLGRASVLCSLHSLASTGVGEVGATITDGNVASEQLFASLGFARVGAWH